MNAKRAVERTVARGRGLEPDAAGSRAPRERVSSRGASVQAVSTRGVSVRAASGRTSSGPTSLRKDAAPTTRSTAREQQLVDERAVKRELMRLDNVGPATADDLVLLGVRKLADLRGRDAFALYGALCARTGARHDPCVIDVLLALVHHADGAPQRPWWHYTPLRKRVLERRAAVARGARRGAR